MALTPLGLIALAIASAAAWAAVLTGVILSPTAARVGPRRATKYGSTFGDIVECWAIARIVFSARSRAPASFLFASCCFRTATALGRECVSKKSFLESASQGCDRGKSPFVGPMLVEIVVGLTWSVHRAPQCPH